MSSFLEKLKKGMGMEENEEFSEKEDFEIKELEGVAPSKKKSPKESLRLPTGQVKKLKKIKTEVVAIPSKKTPEGAEKEMEIQEKTEEKKWPELEGQLAVDVYQTEGELVIQTTVAGIKPEDLDITTQGDVVIIKGKRERVGEEERNYFYQECYWGPFSREIILPVDADTARAEATMVEGVLTIRIPKIEREKMKKITIK